MGYSNCFILIIFDTGKIWWFLSHSVSGSVVFWHSVDVNISSVCYQSDGLFLYNSRKLSIFCLLLFPYLDTGISIHCLYTVLLLCLLMHSVCPDFFRFWTGNCVYAELMHCYVFVWFQGSSVTFYKRFYLHNSVMDYHPKDIMYGFQLQDVSVVLFVIDTCSSIISRAAPQLKFVVLLTLRLRYVSQCRVS